MLEDVIDDCLALSPHVKDLFLQDVIKQTKLNSILCNQLENGSLPHIKKLIHSMVPSGGTPLAFSQNFYVVATCVDELHYFAAYAHRWNQLP